MGVNPRAAHRSLNIAPGPPAELPDTTAAGGVNGVVPPQLGPGRRYRGPGRTVFMPNVTSVRHVARSGGDAVLVPVSVSLDDALVAGQVAVSHRGGLHYDVGEVADEPLVCSRDGIGCPHVDEAIESSRALLESRQIRTVLQGLGQASESSAGVLEADHDASITAGEQAAASAGGGSSWADDPAAFQAAYDAARDRRRRGEPAIPYMTEDATGGLGARNGGRPFGVEIEFNIDPSVNKAAALQAIANDLHAEGLLQRPVQAGYHSSRDYSRWRFERDRTVAGEIVSPVMYDEPESWAQLSKVCEIVRRHGGNATTGSVGGHVHVGVADYDHTVENHQRLLETFRENEDTMYRLAQNPDRSRHRGQRWCQPNPDHDGIYGAPGDIVAFARRNNSHSYALNFGATESGSSTSHVEYRTWDGTLDPGAIQTQVKVSLGMTQAAFGSARPAGPRVAVGTHRAAAAASGRGSRLGGEAWHSDTAGFRGLVDRMFHRDADKAQATALFAVTRWQQG